MKTQLTSYHFDLGDSFSGPIGACARVTARDPERAVSILRSALEVLEREYEVPCHEEGVECLTVYFNPEKFTSANIDDEEPDEEGLVSSEKSDQETECYP